RLADRAADGTGAIHRARAAAVLIRTAARADNQDASPRRGSQSATVSKTEDLRLPITSMRAGSIVTTIGGCSIVPGCAAMCCGNSGSTAISRDCTTADTRIAIVVAIATMSSIGPNHLFALVGSIGLSNSAPDRI